MTKQEWTIERRKFGRAFLVSVAFFLMAIFSPTIFTDEDLLQETMIFDSATFENEGTDYVEVHFSSRKEKVFYIHNEETKFLNRKVFSKLQKGDELLVSYRDEDIYKIKFQNTSLIDKPKVDQYKRESRKRPTWLAICALVLFIIPVLFRKQLTIRAFGKEYGLKMNVLSMGLIAVLLICAWLIITVIIPAK